MVNSLNATFIFNFDLWIVEVTSCNNTFEFCLAGGEGGVCFMVICPPLENDNLAS